MTERLTSEPMSSVDAAWLHMDSATNNAIIVGVFTFAHALDLDRLKATLWERMLARHVRFRQRVVKPRLGLGALRWELDPHFDLDRHVRRVALPSPRDQRALEELVGRMMNLPFDPSRPLWEMYYVEDYAGGSALIARLHHCIADGIALAYVMLGLADASPDAPVRLSVPPVKRRPDGPVLPGVLGSAGGALQAAARRSNALLHEGFETLIQPGRVTQLAREATRAARALAKLVLLPPDRHSLLRTHSIGLKHAAWSAPLALNDVKAVGHVMGGTVNDVLLTAVAGAVGRYLRDRGEDTDGLAIRATVPVNLRPPEEAGELGNRFGLVFLTLPVGIEDAVDRLHALKRGMDAIKDSPEAVVAFGILSAMGFTPTQIEAIIVKIFALKASSVMTNVPGPREPIYLAGEQIERVLFWVPQPGGLSLGVSIMSYSGQVIVGVATDAAAIPDPATVVRCFEAEFAEMHDLVRQVARESRPEPEPAPARCAALTKAGKPCRRRPLPGSRYCGVHAR